MTDSSPSEAADSAVRRQAILLLLAMPLFFSSNIVFGRAAVAEVGPFTLATIRWGAVALILLPLTMAALKGKGAQLRALLPSLLVMGFLGMWACGAVVYLALKYTSATNGTLIYTSSPVLIIVIEFLFKGRAVRFREALGISIAFFGVLTIVIKGSLDNLLALQFNAGDLLFVISAVSWAIYSVGLKSARFEGIGAMPLFMLFAASGTALLLPFAIGEIIMTDALPKTLFAWGNIAGIVVLASLLAFSMFQYGVAVLGASLTGVFLYLLPVYGVTLAVIFLGEELRAFHFVGIALVLGGVILATAPTRN